MYESKKPHSYTRRSINPQRKLEPIVISSTRINSSKSNDFKISKVEELPAPVLLSRKNLVKPSQTPEILKKNIFITTRVNSKTFKPHTPSPINLTSLPSLKRDEGEITAAPSAEYIQSNNHISTEEISFDPANEFENNTNEEADEIQHLDIEVEHNRNDIDSLKNGIPNLEKKSLYTWNYVCLIN
jgi:hypothetical protein